MALGLFFVIVRSGVTNITSDSAAGRAFLGNPGGSKDPTVLGLSIVELVLQVRFSLRYLGLSPPLLALTLLHSLN